MSLLLSLGFAAMMQSPKVLAETPAQHNARMAWFRDARFGVFIHWGLYSVPAGRWNGKPVPGAAEWLQYTAKVDVKDYEPLVRQLNPTQYNPRAWVKAIKQAGAKYIVITSKHHEGFGLWPSKQGDWNISATSYKKDLLKPLAQACKAEGIRLCFYHSIMDWHHPDYLPRREWDPRPGLQPNFERYVRYLKAQLKELLTDYGPISVLWFDGEWESTWTHERGVDLYNYVRTLQPKIIVNNRVDVGRAGMEGTSDSRYAGDYGTPEQQIPANGIPGVDWESCMTMNDTWGFGQDDHNWKSPETLVRNLIDCASKGGNYLLNVGPTAQGEIPGPSLERLRSIGTWLKHHGEAIYGTQASPFPRPLPWGRVTRKGNVLYLHVLNPNTLKIELPGLASEPISARELGGSGPVSLRRTAFGMEVALAPTQSVAPALPRVIKLALKGAPVITTVPIHADSEGTIDLAAIDATIHGTTARYESSRDGIGYWTNPKESVSWNFQIGSSGRYRVVAEIACAPGAEGTSFEVNLGGGSIFGQVPNTGGWDNFVPVTLGEVKLAAGAIEATVKAQEVPHGVVMNLRRVRLVPIP